MSDESAADLLPDAPATIGIWCDLERAFMGTNGYGGVVAEIYAYRLLPRLGSGEPVLPSDEEAAIAARRLTFILQQFVELHPDAEIGLETDPRVFRAFDPRTEELPPFGHRIHIQVLRVDDREGDLAAILANNEALHRVNQKMHRDSFEVLTRACEETRAENARLRAEHAAPAQAPGPAAGEPAPIPMLLWCPVCNVRHIDEGEAAAKSHATHVCQSCGLAWKPAIVPTVGVRFLPGHHDPTEAVPAIALETMTYATRRGRGTLLIQSKDMRLFRHSQTNPAMDPPRSPKPIKCAICGETGPGNAPCPGCGAL